ncbi:hypothetical protein DYGSA30_33740 [Dyella sp. GSA-30]|nr:hypothetical protein DYGSA30_33740 [Dyella sp. GSA-30]
MQVTVAPAVGLAGVQAAYTDELTQGIAIANAMARRRLGQLGKGESQRPEDNPACICVVNSEATCQACNARFHTSL